MSFIGPNRKIEYNNETNKILGDNLTERRILKIEKPKDYSDKKEVIHNCKLEYRLIISKNELTHYFNPENKAIKFDKYKLIKIDKISYHTKYKNNVKAVS